MMKKSVAVIGAGVSGLSAGIYALESGYEVTVYEKNPMPGGECTSWYRKGFHIDNCLHFLVGCNHNEKLNEMWTNLGVLSDDVQLYREPYFYCLDINGKTLYLWRDLERAKKELLEIAPEDYKELELFFDCVKGAECVRMPCEKAPAHMNAFEYIKMGFGMMGASKANREYGRQTMREFVERFKNPYIRALFGNYLNSDSIALTFVTSYAFYTGGTAAIPTGGSVGMVGRMRRRFESLGGNLRLGTEIEKIVLENGRTVCMQTGEGERIDADYFIWCADPWKMFSEMIGAQYLDDNLRYMYDNPAGYTSFSCFQAAFGIRTDKELESPDGTVFFPCEPYSVAGETYEYCGMRTYNYDEGLWPKDKRVIQCNILQNSSNFDYWRELKRTLGKYDEEKMKIAEELRKRIETQYPGLKGKLELLGTYSPVTFSTWCNAYKGAYMSFSAKKGYRRLYVKSTIRGIDNMFLGSQWIMNDGGLPVAAASGRFAVDRMYRKDKELSDSGRQ